LITSNRIGTVLTPVQQMSYLIPNHLSQLPSTTLPSLQSNSTLNEAARINVDDASNPQTLILSYRSS